MASIINASIDVTKITKELKKDADYRRSWSANIAMAYIDNETWYKKKTGKKTLNRKDKHTIANNAAEHFLKLLCDEYKYPSREVVISANSFKGE